MWVLPMRQKSLGVLYRPLAKEIGKNNRGKWGCGGANCLLMARLTRWMSPDSSRQSGRSSGVEHNLAKVGVEGSNPFARSNVNIHLVPNTGSTIKAALLARALPNAIRSLYVRIVD
jgi:hypothetical protein